MNVGEIPIPEYAGDERSGKLIIEAGDDGAEPAATTESLIVAAKRAALRVRSRD